MNVRYCLTVVRYALIDKANVFNSLATAVSDNYFNSFNY